jgi:hypothetical protein
MAGRTAASSGTWPSEHSYQFLVQLLWCRCVAGIKRRFEEAADMVQGRLFRVRHGTVRTAAAEIFANSAEGVIDRWKDFRRRLYEPADLNACFDGLKRALGESVFEPLANLRVTELKRCGENLCRQVHRRLSSPIDMPRPRAKDAYGPVQESCDRLCGDPAFRRAAADFRGDYALWQALCRVHPVPASRM